jgi:hypothetical protein
MRIVTIITEFLIKIITSEFLFSKSHIIVFFLIFATLVVYKTYKL